MKRLLLTACIVGLAACGGSKDDVDTGYEDIIRGNSQSLIYAFPINEQRELPISSPVVLHFSSQIVDPAGANVILKEQGGDEVAVTISAVENGKGLVITPVERLKPLTDYEVNVPALALADGESKERVLRFTTRGLHEGPRTAVSRDTFTVERRFPDGANLPVADMSTLRLQMSQPIDRSTVKYGASGDSTVQLTDANDNLVEAYVLVGDNYLTIDPKSDLIGGQSYTLSISPDLKSRQGESLPGSGLGNANFTWQFTPIDTRPPATAGNPDRARARMIQVIDDSNVDSPLTGKRVNLVPMYSVLLGPEGSSNPATPQASGYLAAELAHIPEHDETTPLRIDRGSLIVAGDLPVYIGGEVPAGFNSGKVNMEFLSDATGYMIENPYSDDAAAPKLVRLMMDMGISAEGDIANGSVTQTLMHIELVGTALVEDGVLTLNAVGVVEPNILGTERASAVLSFYMQGLDDQVNAPEPPVDERPLVVQSWTMADQTHDGKPNKALWANPSDPIIINFNRALDPESVAGKVKLLLTDGNGTDEEQEISVYSDGAALVVKPKGLLAFSEELNPASYRLMVDAGLQDISGAEWSGHFDEEFTLPTHVEQMDSYRKGFTVMAPWTPESTGLPVKRKSPFLLGLYPGYPCALETADQDLAAGVSGRCKGGIQPHAAPGALDPLPADDLLPVAGMPANRPIVVIFSKAIDPASVELGSTFEVFEIDDQDTEIVSVSGKLSLAGDTLRFTPSSPWKEGSLYKYRIASNGDVSSNAGSCDIEKMLCSHDGLPVQTQLLSEISISDTSNTGADIVYWPYYVTENRSPSLTGGGPDLIQYFRGEKESESVLQLLRLADGLDTNANLVNDSTAEMFGPIPAQANGVTVLAGISFNRAQFFEYARSETDNVVWEEDNSTGHLVDRHGVKLDPGGVRPPPNSAKILSRDLSVRTVAEAAEKQFDHPNYMIASGSATGAHVGCAYEQYLQADDQTGCDTLMPNEFIDGQLKGVCYYGIPAECPQDKFTYINGVLFAEVTDQGQGQDVLVNIYPGHMVTTSFKIYMSAPLRDARGLNVVDTGYQLIRMRYDDMRPLRGKIYEEHGITKLKADDVPLYMDAPYLRTDIVIDKGLINQVHHNLYSYPVEVSLEGPVSFLDDGRMVAEQFSKNDILIEQKVNAPAARFDLIVPKGGIHIKYVSEPIK